MKRWFLAGSLAAGVLTAIACWLLTTSGKSAINRITARWAQASWSEERRGRPTTQSEGFEYRSVLLRNEGPREIASVCILASANPDGLAVEKAARDVAGSRQNLGAGHEIEIHLRRAKGEPMTVSLIAFDFTASELATRIQQRTRFPWARRLLPLRHRMITLPED